MMVIDHRSTLFSGLMKIISWRCKYWVYISFLLKQVLCKKICSSLVLNFHYEDGSHKIIQINSFTIFTWSNRPPIDFFPPLCVFRWILKFQLDCWDGPDGEPLIYHGWTLTSKLLFKVTLFGKSTQWDQLCLFRMFSTMPFFLMHSLRRATLWYYR